MTAAPDAPSNAGLATNPTRADVVVVPPAKLAPSGSPWQQYQLTVCPVRGPYTACIRQTCATLKCPVRNLSPLTTYTVQTVAIAADGSRSVPSNEDQFTTPAPIA